MKLRFLLKCQSLIQEIQPIALIFFCYLRQTSVGGSDPQLRGEQGEGRSPSGQGQVCPYGDRRDGPTAGQYLFLSGAVTNVSVAAIFVFCDETIVSFYEKLISCAETIISGDKTIVSADETTVYVAETSVSDAATIVSCDETIVSGAETIVSCDETIVSFD